MSCGLLAPFLTRFQTETLRYRTLCSDIGFSHKYNLKIAKDVHQTNDNYKVITEDNDGGFHKSLYIEYICTFNSSPKGNADNEGYYEQIQYIMNHNLR